MTTRRKIGIMLVSPIVGFLVGQMIRDLGLFGSVILIAFFSALIGGMWLIVSGGDE